MLPLQNFKEEVDTYCFKAVGSTFSSTQALPQHKRHTFASSVAQTSKLWTGTTGLKLTVPLIYLPDGGTVLALLDLYQVSDDNQGVNLGIYAREIHGESTSLSGSRATR